MNYRLLPAEEFEKLKPFCERNNVPMPKSETSLVGVAEQDGEVRYVHMMHLQFHLDNCVRDKDWKGFFDFRKVYDCLESALPDNQEVLLYTYPSFEGGMRAAKILGFEPTKYPLMMKRVLKEKVCQSLPPSLP